ncbi:MAG: isochorismate synthase [Solirubrobacteraceae bacterium]|nr:isochorismate synthase [Patulibacter sp.]
MSGDVLTHRPDRPLALDQAALGRLRDRVHRAAGRSRGEAVLVSATSKVEAPASLGDLLRGSGLSGEPWALIEQPDRGRRGILALGAATTIPLGAQPGERFRALADRWHDLASHAQADPGAGIPGGGLILIGGAAFSPGGGTSSTWQTFGGGDMVVPSVSVACLGHDAALTVTVLVEPGADPTEILAEAQLSTALLVAEPPEPADPFLDAPEVRSVLAAGHFTAAVERAVATIGDGAFTKIVLAREIEVRSEQPWDVPTVLARLGARFPACFVFGFGRGDGAMVGASPELLLRRDGQRVETVALAGSTRRSNDPSVDEHLAQQLLASTKDRAEHALVVERILRTLGPHALWVTAPKEPQVATVANVHHLATPIRAQLDGRARLLDLVGAMHPTPAVGGEPGEAALRAIPALEGIDRGWYAGPLGWVDRAGDGELFVGLRSGVLRGDTARLFAGVGVVGASDPSSELAETELKLEAVLSALRPAH